MAHDIALAIVEIAELAQQKEKAAEQERLEAHMQSNRFRIQVSIGLPGTDHAFQQF